MRAIKRSIALFSFLLSYAFLQAQALPPNSIVIVGQHRCPACQAAVEQLPLYLPKWAAKGIDVRYYSLDSLAQDYSRYPLPVTRLAQRWDAPLIKRLNTYATPSFYFINAQGEVVVETATAAEMQLALMAQEVVLPSQ